MFRYVVFSLVCLLVRVRSSEGNPITNEVETDDELVLAMVVNRHGERAPDEDELSFSELAETIRNLTYIEGLEGLTNIGKRRGYYVGKFYKQRYGPNGLKLISNLYLATEISIRSTDKERTKMMVLSAMAAAYPPEEPQQWDDGLGKVWQPVPYVTVPLKEDYLRFYSNCKKFDALMEEAKAVARNDEFCQFADLATLLNEKTGRNFTENPLLFQIVFDLFKSMVALGLDIPEWAKPIFPRLSEAARLAYNLYYKTEEMRKISGGVLLHKFMEAADEIISGKDVKQRLIIISAHDFNVGGLLEAAQVKTNKAIPEYGAVFALELYRSKKTGAYRVMPVYLPQAGNSSLQHLHFIGCEESAACDFNKFSGFVRNSLLPEREYFKICNIKTEL